MERVKAIQPRDTYRKKLPRLCIAHISGILILFAAPNPTRGYKPFEVLIGSKPVTRVIFYFNLHSRSDSEKRVNICANKGISDFCRVTFVWFRKDTGL